MQVALQMNSPGRVAHAEIDARISVAISAASAALRGRIAVLVRHSGARLVPEGSSHVLLLEVNSSTSALMLEEAAKKNKVCAIWTDPEPARSSVSKFLRAGVSAVVSIDIDASKFQATLRAIHSGLQVVDAALTTKHAHEVPASDSPGELTPREQQVLEMMAEGLANKEISGRLAISTHTVKFHISSILGKLGAASRTEAVSIGVRSGRLTI